MRKWDVDTVSMCESSCRKNTDFVKVDSEMLPVNRIWSRTTHRNYNHAASVPHAIQAPDAASRSHVDRFDGASRVPHGDRMSLKSLRFEEMERWCDAQGESRARALHLWRWMYADDMWMRDMQDTVGVNSGFSQRFVDKAREAATVDGGLELSSAMRAKDGTRKLAFKLTQGEAAGRTIETVLIPVIRESGQRHRITICVSSQVGCAMNCQFCLTGRMGLLGNLSTAQIVEQVVQAKRLLAADGDRTPLTNLVFMGMGEPLHNLEAVLASIDIMTSPLGLHMSRNKITVSTVGLVPEIREWVSRSGGRGQLAVSLHATTDEVRDWLVPINRRYNIGALLSCLEELFPRPGGEGGVPSAAGQQPAVLIEYIMLRGINDSEEDARRLASILKPINCKVNLIQFNPHAGTKFFPSDNDTVLRFRSIIIQAGRVCTIRDSRGDDEMAACGQLGNPETSPRPAPILEPPAAFQGLMSSDQGS